MQRSVSVFLLLDWVHLPSRVFSDAGPGLLLLVGEEVWRCCVRFVANIP